MFEFISTYPEAFFIALGLIFSGLGALYLWGKNKWLKKWLDKTNLDEMAEQVVTSVYHDTVKDWKKAAKADGKLTKEQASKAMEMAVQRLKTRGVALAKTKGKDLVVEHAKEWGEDGLKWILEKAITRMKNGTPAAASAPSP